MSTAPVAVEPAVAADAEEVRRIQAAQGQRTGSALMRAGLRFHGDRRDVYCHVAEYNDGAIRFYQRFGFVLTGRRFDGTDGPPGAQIPELEMLRVSGTTAPPSQ
jgi:RimJ/RimL family protein N-acetyltransferase